MIKKKICIKYQAITKKNNYFFNVNVKGVLLRSLKKILVLIYIGVIQENILYYLIKKDSYKKPPLI